ncbi:phage tail tape measure C-terminal domain-containing protein [Klebsiella pneumoniae]|uniref:phage tail tape measure C-terminal domain-containing protein n=1 Tax=Klebsiella pneumoniae TaxID=573 RepID=UPI000C7A7696|nr:phage tail tape measure C-terminal domain-containing protein [Klebsiella pneumoniae]ELO7449813.1 phage tail tape measure protein [Klebsiella pneumoniae]MCJ8609778.1 phage tail tape measure protein [Klebsiella pneumoniae]MEA4697061.1 phage tail tape measure C-terminal domain-containing protein [Klebsiella pneumoniae]SYE49789.1 phage tail tape measure protein, lambda family [Klebsiella pneumoniae]SYG08133.1 phage tail tape measure protein, lambda family [Klebsiella pneumoniae]
MAGKSLGTLTIDLIAKVGGFVQGMGKAERASQKWSDQVKKDAKEVSSAIIAVGAAAATAAVGIGAAGLSIVKNTAQQVTEADRWAKSLKMSTQDLLSWQYAAEQAGLTGDNIADIFKDINDKVGDAVLNKSGEAAQALDTLGLSAKKLSEQSPDKQLMAISEALQKIPSQAGKTNILESLGNDLSKMLPLFENNNEKLKQFIQLSKDFGIAPPQEDIDNLVKVNQFFQDIEASARGLKMEIASGLAKVDLTPLQSGLDDIRDVFTDPAVLQGLSDLVGEAISLAGVVGRIAGGLGTIAAYTRSRIGAVSGNYDAADERDIEERIRFLGKRGNQSREQKEELDFLNKRLSFLRSIKGTLTPEQIDKGAKGLTSLLSDLGIDTPKSDDYSLGKGDSNQKQPKAKKNATDNAFKSRLLDLQKQAALIETTGKKTAKVTELEKINFDISSGNLKKLSESQKEQLRTAAKVLDARKEELRTNKENAKLAEYVSVLNKQNKLVKQGYDNELSGLSFGGKDRERMREINSIQQDYETRQEELLNQFQAGDIEESLYEKKKTALKKALEERLQIQKDYYHESDDLRNDWQSGISSALADFADSSTDYYQQAADAMTSILGAATDSVSEHLYDVVSGTESMGEAIKGVFADLGQAVIKALVDMAAQWIVYQGVQMLVNKTAQASAIPAMIANAQATALQAQLAAFASTAAIPIVGPGLAPAAMAAAAAVTEPMVAAISAASLSGMAHDGVDSVPETGTWLLQKGERVTTAKTSAKLDATLDRVANQSTGGATYAPSMSFYVNGDPSDAQIAMMKKAASDGAQMGYQKAVQSIATGQGDLHKALMGKTTSGRKIS